VIAQTLHGYDQGHRLLAQGGDLDDVELSLLDRLSDLSGYVPLGTEFGCYHTGFPCGRYYAFACTWPDKSASRAGTVLTHSLLVPRDALENIQDLWGLGHLHRQPLSAADRDSFATALPLALEEAREPPPGIAAERARSAIVLWFGQPDRPVLWVEETRPADVVRFLWSIMWPEARGRFSFCTFALQVRYLRNQSFAFLGLPPAARGAFHERARSAAWWEDGRLVQPELAERTGQAWVRGIAKAGAEATWAMPRFCKANTLPVPQDFQLPVFIRFMRLEESATARLTAARARADLLDRLWPALTPTHPLARAILRQVMALQAEAPTEPRPFWELGDFLHRGPVRRLAEVDQEFAAELADTVSNEIRTRLERVTPEQAHSFGSLLRPEPISRVQIAIVDAVRFAFGIMPVTAATDAKATALLFVATDVEAPLLTDAVLAALPPTRRASIASQAIREADASAAPRVVDYVVAAAYRLDDPFLAAEAWTASNQTLRGLRDAAAVVRSAPRVDPERLQPILQRLPSGDRFSWALETADLSLGRWAGARGAEAAKELGILSNELFERCRAAPNGARVLLAYFAALAPELTTDDLLSPAIATALTSDSVLCPWAEPLVRRITVRLVQFLARGVWSPGEPAMWLSVPAVQNALAHISPWSLFVSGGPRPSDQDCLPNVARAIADYVSGDADAQIYWASNLLSRPLDEAQSTSFARALNDLTLLMALPPERRGWPQLAAALLVTVRRTGCPIGHRVVQLTFPILYPMLVRGDLDLESRAQLSKFGKYGADIPRALRHWLLDSWIEHRWPAASFLWSLGANEALFLRVAHRATKTRRGREFILSLRQALNGDSVLSEHWSRPLTQVISESRSND
jgi:GTPase-associated protein 1, N-terminal domain type 1